MTEEKRIKQLEKEVETMKARLDYIEKFLHLVPDQAELERAIELMLDSRDNSALDLYLKRGGKIPHID